LVAPGVAGLLEVAGVEGLTLLLLAGLLDVTKVEGLALLLAGLDGWTGLPGVECGWA